MMSDEIIQSENNLPLPQNNEIKSLFERLHGLIQDVEEANDDISSIVNQGFLGRFVSNVKGETAQAFAKAQDLQAQLQEVQIALAFVNLKLVGQIKEQQDLIEQQQSELTKSNERIENQQAEINEATSKIKKQQKTIFKILNLTQEQEEKIREVVQTSEYVKNLEKAHNRKIDNLSKELKDTRTKIENDYQKIITSEVDNLNQEIQKLSRNLVEGKKNINDKISEISSQFKVRFQFSIIAILIALVLSIIAILI
ncbi:MAG: hypothetical protein ROO71_12750 [Balneola sp.]